MFCGFFWRKTQGLSNRLTHRLTPGAVVIDAFTNWLRVFARGICFGVFGLGALLLNGLAFPLLKIFIHSTKKRTTISKAWMHYLFRLFVGLMRALNTLSLEVKGAERLQRQGLLIVANHPSLIDAVLLISLIKQADCVVKSHLQHNWLTKATVVNTGYLCNDRGFELLQEAIFSMHSGNNVIVFPEGTRTLLATPGKSLQRGAAHLAVRGGVNITPIRIKCTPPTLLKGEPWYKVPIKRSHFVIEVCQDIEVAHFRQTSPSAAIATRRLTAHLADFFSWDPEHATST
jgi:1-acyl-sn-glycerol-3-phosphate acyltransferase